MYKRPDYTPYSTYRHTKSGTKRINVSLQTRVTTQLTLKAASNNTNVIAISPFGWPNNAVMSVTGALADIPSYVAYSTLFDQVKLNSFYVRFNVNRSLPGLVDATSDLLTAIDRNGTESDLTQDHDFTFPMLRSSSSTLRTNFNGHSTFTTNRSYYASDMLEKYTFYDATPSKTNVHQIIAWKSSSVTGFTPILFFGMETSLTPSSATRSIRVDLDIVYNLTFRNPKNGMNITGASKSITPRSKENLSLEPPELKLEPHEALGEE